VVLAGTLIGARLGHCLIYEPAYYFNHPTEFIKIWHGGLASHGGALGILVALGLYCRRHRDLGYLWILDRLTVPAALGGAFIRLGNFFNSEIIGRPTDLPWGVVFTRVDGLARHPVQLYESAAYAAVFLVLLTVYLKARKPREGLLIGLFLTAVFSARFLLEFAKERQAPYGESLVLSVGQMLSLPMVALGLALIVWSVRRPVRPVTVSGQR
jgi:prolipoprotein diacylglyceryl transferase